MKNDDSIDKQLKMYSLADLPQKVQIGIQDGYCNLKCPMCFTHSGGIDLEKRGLRGKMSLENFCRILDEVIDVRPTISPYRWSEPLVVKDFPDYMYEVKKRNFPVFINTNGLLLTNKLAEFFVNIKLDSITFSVDATSNETFRKMRGVDVLDKVKEIVFKMIEIRGTSEYPRIGVSMALGEINEHEKDEFVSFWTRHVDVVRINKMYSKDKNIHNFNPPGQRVPCSLLYNTMNIDYKGDVTICCLDALNTMVVGNVFDEGVRQVWHGERFTKIRNIHERSEYHEIPFCQGCSTWANSEFKEWTYEGVLIRESPIMTFYNRTDKLTTWKVENTSNP